MLSVRSALLVLAISAASVGCTTSSWEAAVEDANKAEKVLIVEFYADWCGPCKRFERNVLNNGEVKTALQRVEFRRFNFDTTAGKRYAHSMGIRSIPAVVAVDRKGKGFRALRGAVPKEVFLEFLAWTETQVYPGRQAPPAS